MADGAPIMEEIKRVRDEIQAGNQKMKGSYLIKAYNAILELHERIAALEAKSD